MIIETDPMSALKQDAEQKINVHFNAIGAATAQQDAEHLEKRRQAQGVVQGSPPSADFAAAAAAEGASALDLAKTVLAKPNEVLVRGLERRKKILAVRVAKTPAELSAILADIDDTRGLPR